MEIKYFNEFVELSRIGSYTVAARKLHISQSVLSKHIKAMEDELGVPLFARRKSGIELSEFGLLLLPYANQIISIRENYEEAILTQITPDGGYLKIATIPSVNQLGITELIAGFSIGNPNLSVNIMEEESSYLLECLLRQEVDLAFARGAGNYNSELVRIPYMTDHIVAVAPKSHPLATRQNIILQDICNEELVISGENNYAYLMFRDACRRENLEPNVSYTNNNGELLDLVEKCMCVAIVNEQPSFSKILSRPNVVKLHITPWIETMIYIYYHPKNITSIAEKFLRYTVEEKKLSV